MPAAGQNSPVARLAVRAFGVAAPKERRMKGLSQFQDDVNTLRHALRLLGALPDTDEVAEALDALYRMEQFGQMIENVGLELKDTEP